ncbi:orotidine 5'-phosphate decarboxylase / HUMPS family protein [Sulfolobus sp. E11-6]|uniref:orotidine 5'-phosphate decarboxylase / HUMPS family protein n=1 Tax=Sulfolobus sp. E11-6 TaxID=2663020 RepID=UPI001296423A|nr:orotidine 5'-phosphate decarboxylase / HUMPS family protein [Sulfolobus sp. E11-6]QGA67490.1 orotidine 5'-phosphate decarboxylase [Sulfolobus sp. E11-6]
MLKSRIILAMDKPLSYQTLKEMENEIYGIKVGLPLVLDLGVHKTRELLNDLNVEEIIVDFKLADIGYIMKSIVEKLSFANSFIAHSFVGVKGALDELKKYLDTNSKNLYLVAVMSHEGWSTLFTDYIKNVIREISPKGIVVGGTKLDSITQYRKEFTKITIISPGMGSQGGIYGDAICAGADYEIIGRSIYNADDPFTTIKTINKIIEEKVMNCKGAIFREK